MVGIRVNYTETNRLLDESADLVSDMTPFWNDAFDDVIVPRVKEVFETRGFGSWLPRKDNLPHPLLRKTERLYESLTNRGHPDTRWQAFPDHFEFGTGVEYAVYHERGTRRIPPRPYLFYLCTPEFEQQLANYGDIWIQNRLGRIAA